jgi:hypothetical protein
VFHIRKLFSGGATVGRSPKSVEICYERARAVRQKVAFNPQQGALRLGQPGYPRVVRAEIGGTRPMASESVYLQVAKAAWDWIQQDINVWMRALGDLKAVLMARDLESDETVIYALRFSAFSICVAILVDIPPYIIFGKPLAFKNLIANFILYYIVAFVFAICTKVVAVLVRSNVSLRVCFMMALFATVYFSPVNLIDYVTFSDQQMRRILLREIPTLSTFAAFATQLSNEQIFILAILFPLTTIIYLYVAIKMISASRYVFKVGGFRATVIVSGSVLLHDVIQMTVMRPVFDALSKAQFGA